MQKSNKSLLDEAVELVDSNIRYFLQEVPQEMMTEEYVYKVYRLQFPINLNAFAINPKFSPLFPVDQEEMEVIAEGLAEEYVKKMEISKPSGFSYVSKECAPWVEEAKDSIHWFYWSRYKRYLIKKLNWGNKVVESIEKDTLRTLDLMVDPSIPGAADRRGLVVADVQSGKTANYIGLMSRAADAGYRVIVVLAGIYNVLRAQTQIRIEEGFAGYNVVTRECVGAGDPRSGEDKAKRPFMGTSRVRDFGKQSFEPLMGVGANNDSPWVFVIKKNPSVIRNLLDWMEAHPELDGPLLLIDDEADNASINVKYAIDEVSRINGLVRKLLKHFKKSSYVGYTATPYANIFIDPKSETDAEGEDIFPRSFIYTLESSSSYFGSDKVFADLEDEDVRPAHVRTIDDLEDVLPVRHRKDIPVFELPGSLKEAIRTFVLASTERALRNEGNRHTTMMVNVSPYKLVQQQIYDLTSDYLDTIRSSSFACGSLPITIAEKDPMIRALKKTWENEFDNGTRAWPAVLPKIYVNAKKIHVVLINSASQDSLNYEEPNVEHVIAVGGYRLSRGLTLEGLITSYYSRNAKAYDTLMQMARWYGYRGGYEDLCRIWMTEDAIQWYSYVADAQRDLIDQLRQMRRENQEPSVYGLMVRESPNSLRITARNKMGVGQKQKITTNFGGSFVETTILHRERDVVGKNYEAADRLITALIDGGYEKRSIDSAADVFVEVPSGLIRSFVSEFSVAPENMTLIKDVVLRSISDLENSSRGFWDVAIMHGSVEGAEFELTTETGKSAKCERRFPGRGTNKRRVYVGNKSRLAGRDVEKYGLKTEQREEARRESNDKRPGAAIAGALYRKHRSRPLLVIHPLIMKYKVYKHKGSQSSYKHLVEDTHQADWPSFDYQEQNIGLSISYPVVSDRNLLKYEYVLNGPMLAQLDALGVSDELDEDDPDER